MRRKMGLQIAAAAMAMTLASPFAAMAEGTTYTAQAGGTTKFDKYVVMKNDANVPTMTVSFTITPVENGIAATNTTFEVIKPDAANGVTGYPSVSSVTFGPEDNTTLEASKKNGETINFMTTGEGKDNDEKYAVKQSTVDFSGVGFSEPGVYRWIVKETDPKVQGITADDKPRTLDVYVTDDGTGKLAVSSYVLHTGTDAPVADDNKGTKDATKTDVADKSSGFTNQLQTYDLSFQKKVTGNQGSRDKYFKYTVKVGDGVEGAALNDADRFLVDMHDADTAPVWTKATAAGYTAAVMKKANSLLIGTATTSQAFGDGKMYLTGAQLKAGYDFYLKANQSIMIQGLTKDAKYTLTETAEDYKSTAKTTDYTDETTGNMTKDMKTGFTNTRDGIIPTGINDQAKRGILTVVVCAAALALILIGKRRKKNAQ